MSFLSRNHHHVLELRQTMNSIDWQWHFCNSVILFLTVNLTNQTSRLLILHNCRCFEWTITDIKTNTNVIHVNINSVLKPFPWTFDHRHDTDFLPIIQMISNLKPVKHHFQWFLIYRPWKKSIPYFIWVPNLLILTLCIKLQKYKIACQFFITISYTGH